MKVCVLRGRLWIALLAAVVTAVTTLGQTTINLNPGDDIQAAIGAASGGDTIVLAPGVYDVPQTIVVNKSLMISSAGATLQGTTASALCVLEVAASNVTISGLGITWATLLESTPAGAELTDSLVRIPANLHLSGVVIVGNTIYLPAQSGAMSTWVARALTIGSHGCADITIADNTVYNTRNGIVIQYNNTASLTGNTIYSTKGGMMNYTNTLADAANRTMSDNSWGTTHNEWDIVWNSANYDPDYQESVIALSAANEDAYVVDRRDAAGGHALGNRSHIFVTPTGTTAVSEVNGNINTPYASLSLGIDAVATHGIVHVASGAYTGQALVGRDMDLAASAGASCVAPTSPTTVTVAETTTVFNPIVFVYGGTMSGGKNVTGAGITHANVTGFDIDGQNRSQAGTRFVGILLRNAEGEISGNTIHGMYDADGQGNGPQTFGILVYGDSDVNLLSNVISDFSRGGIGLLGDLVGTSYVRGSATDPNGLIQGNTVVGNGYEAGTNWWAENGIQIGYGATGQILENTVLNCQVHNASWSSSGIIIVGSDNVLVARNTSSGSDNGIAIMGLTAWGGIAATGNVLESNDVTGNEYGIALQYDAVNTAITRNVISGNAWEGMYQYGDGSSAEPYGTTLRYNVISGNGYGVVNWGVLETMDAILNWWGASDGPIADEDFDGTAEYTGSGDTIYGSVLYSPWLGTNPDGDASAPGVQVTAPVLIVVAPVGPEPSGGYLNAAIVGSNSGELPYADTIYLEHGEYDGSQPITQPVTLISEPGSASHTTVTGAMNIGSGAVTVGLPLQGLRIDGDITVGNLVDAATVHINWCDLYGTATNNGDNTLDAQYNFWGTQEEAVIDARTIGDIDYAPYLPKNADDSYTDITALLTAGVAGSLNGAVDQLWTLTRMGQDVGAYIAYQGMAGSGALHATPANGQVVASLLPGGGGGAVTSTGVAGGYVVGETIVGQVQVLDPATGLPVSDAIVTISLLNAESGVVYWGVATYDENLGEYVFEVDTNSLASGTYELIVQTDDGETETLTVVVAAA